MATSTGMLRRMMIRRTITTQRHAACLTRAQVDPSIPDLHTLFTLMTLRLPDRLNSFDMSTTFILIHNGNILPQKCLSHKEAQKHKNDRGSLRNKKNLFVL